MLNPNFLKRIDRYLLLNYPLVWTSKLHYVTYYWLILFLLHIPIATISNLDDLSTNDIEVFYSFTAFVVAALIIIWLVFYLRHNSSKQFGKRTPGREWVNMLCSFLCLVMISSVFFIFPGMMLFKSIKMIEKNHVVEKVNSIHLGSPFFPSRFNESISQIEAEKSVETREYI